MKEAERIALGQEIDTLLAKGLNYEEVLAVLSERGYGKKTVEDLVLSRILAKSANQPHLLKKSEESVNFDALHKRVEKAARPLKMTIWEVLGGVGSAIVLILISLGAVWYGVETGNVFAFVFALGCFVAAFLNISSNYRGMW